MWQFIELLKNQSQYHQENSLECKSNESTNDNSCIKNIPKISAVRTWMKYNAKVDDLKQN